MNGGGQFDCELHWSVIENRSEFQLGHGVFPQFR